MENNVGIGKEAEISWARLVEVWINAGTDQSGNSIRRIASNSGNRIRYNTCGRDDAQGSCRGGTDPYRSQNSYHCRKKSTTSC